MAIETSSPKKNIIAHSDIPTNLAIHPLKRDMSLIVNESAVKRSIRNILLTNKYERPMNPTFGCNLRGFLFEIVTPAVVQAIKAEISQAIANYEPRAYVHDISVSEDIDRNSLNISILFSVRLSSEVQRLDVILDRTR